jgi:hypothetical protein
MLGITNRGVYAVDGMSRMNAVFIDEPIEVGDTINIASDDPELRKSYRVEEVRHPTPVNGDVHRWFDAYLVVSLLVD